MTTATTTRRRPRKPRLVFEIVPMLPPRQGGAQASASTRAFLENLVPLRNRPGEWAIVMTGVYGKFSRQQTLKRAANKNLGGHWQITKRGPDIYAKYEQSPNGH